MEQGYQRAFARLNQKQKAAVEYIDGPLLVIAGPGTGKTELLSLRVANILRQTDTDPANIICLTFTNYATNNMQQRLFSYIGPEAYRVNIKTFHSYAAEIIQQFPEYFFNGAKLSIVPDAVQIDIISTILDQLPLDNPLVSRFNGQYTRLRDIKEALKLVKDGGLTPDKLRGILKANEKYIERVEEKLVSILSERLSAKKLDKLVSAVNKIPIEAGLEENMPLSSLSSVIKDSLSRAIELDEASGNLKNVSKWKSRWIQTINLRPAMWSERKANNWWQNIADVYGLYTQALISRGFYDYSDMIIEVLDKLENQPELLALVQEKYQYVLIDEFQDTNSAQFRLAHLSANNIASEGKPNIMAVGDDDQTIYAFNGAEINNMLGFLKHYPTTKIIALTDNYRSHQSILDISEGIISLSSSRLVSRLDGVNKQLKTVSKAPGKQIAHINYPTKAHQLSELATAIKSQWDENKDQSIAVLARNNASLIELSAWLIKLGVNISYEKQNNILEDELVAQLILLANIVEAINSGEQSKVSCSISKLLKYPAWRIKPASLWQLSLEAYSRKRNWLDQLLVSKDKRLVSYGQWFLWLAKQSVVEPLPLILEYLVGLKASVSMTSPLKSYYLDSKKLDNSYLDSLSALNVLLKLTNDFLVDKSTVPKLKDFLELININLSANEIIADGSWFSTNEKSVELMTVHKAKGLEFDKVYLIDATNKQWSPRPSRLKSPANLPLQPYGEDIDDYIRLAYVAATRARSSFVVSSYNYSSDGEQVLPSPLFSNLKIINFEVDNEPENNIAILERQIAWPDLRSSNIKALLEKRLKNFKLSSTGYNQYLDIVNNGPEAFFEKNVLRLPEPTSPQMAFGNAMHAALEQAQNDLNLKTLSLKNTFRAFSESLKKQSISLHEQERYLIKGKSVLENILKSKSLILTKGAQAEVGFSEVKLPSGAVINGKIDNLATHGRELIITDYKTGKPLANFTSKAQDKALKSWQHKNQLLFYYLLIKYSNRYKNIKSIKTRIVYVEADTPGTLILEYFPSKEELDKTLKLIGIVFSHVTNLKLDDISGYERTIKGLAEFEDRLIN